MNEQAQEQVNTQTLMSQSEVERFANIPHSRFARLVQSKGIAPSFRQGKNLLFTREAAEAIRTQYAR